MTIRWALPVQIDRIGCRLLVAGLTALQALRDKGRDRAGHKVLVNGAPGRVGTFAVQPAKSFGAQVTGVRGTPNVEMVTTEGNRN